MTETNLYKLLELEKSATEEQIKKAYKRMSMKHHPDRGGDEAKFKAMKEAYEVLSNPQSRAHYDQTGRTSAGAAGGDYGYADFGDFGAYGDAMHEFMNRGGRGRPQKQKKQTSIIVDLTEVETYTGVTKTVKYKVASECGTCDGTGSKTKTKHVCKHCNGTGSTIRSMGGMHMRSTCAHCNGTGEAEAPAHDKCPDCASGVIWTDKVRDIDFPPGIFDSAQLQFMEENTIVIVTIRVTLANPKLQRDGLNIVYKQQIELVDLLCGTELEVEVYGRKFNVTVKPGSRDNQHMRIRGVGFKHPQGGPQIGDLIVVLDTLMPAVKPEHRDALTELLKTTK